MKYFAIALLLLGAHAADPQNASAPAVLKPAAAPVVDADEAADVDDADDKVPGPVKFLASASSAPVVDSAKSLEMTSAEMEAAMTDLMLGKTAFGATPMGGSVKKIKDLLEKTMKPKVLAAHSADQKELNRLVEEIKKCGKIKNSALGAAAPHSRKYRSNSRDHKRCRNDEAVKFTSQKNCLVEQKNLHQVKIGKCNAFSTLKSKLATTKNNRAVVTKAGGESVDSYILRISTTICGKHVHGHRGNKKAGGGWGGGLSGGYLDQYLRAKEACERATKKWKAKVKECRIKVAAWKTRKGQCDQFQELMDASSCKAAIISKDACESYATCYHEAVKVYRIAEKKVQIEETDRKAEWRGLNRMSCLINAFADGKVTGAEVDACKKKSVDTKRLH